MCLNYKQPIQAEKLDAYKIFAYKPEDKILVSPFRASSDIPYQEENTYIDDNSGSAGFYSFLLYDHGVDMLRGHFNGTARWDLKRGYNLVILPVTAVNVTYLGYISYSDYRIGDKYVSVISRKLKVDLSPHKMEGREAQLKHNLVDVLYDSEVYTGKPMEVATWKTGPYF